MAIKGSGTLWHSEIGTEFGRGSPMWASEYFRGGSRVPNVSQNNAIPTWGGGALQASQFYNASAATLVLTPSPASNSIFRAEPAPTLQTVSVNCTASGAGVTSVTWTWISGGTFTVSTNGLNANFSASLQRNASRSGVYRCTANNGLTRDVTVTLSYTTDA